MILGYNTNGFAHHSFADACAIILKLGYQSLALTIEREILDPPDRSGVADAIRKVQKVLGATDARVTIETGARFILDPWRKHQPTMLSADLPERERRIEFLCSCIDLAARIQADSVSLWSGKADGSESTSHLMNRLSDSLKLVLEHAEHRNVRISFEPEPGMFIETMQQYEEVFERLSHPLFGLTLDVGHVHCLNDGVVADHVSRWRERLWNVHLEDMSRGVHEHLMFGDGDLDVPEVFDALRAVSYRGPVHVELSRHSHDAVSVAKRAYEFLRPMVAVY